MELQIADVSEETALALRSAMGPGWEAAKALEARARAIVVTDAGQTALMNEARELRLQLKSIRVSTEKTRKELKAESLRKVRAIDGVANIIEYLIAPLEEHLDRQENFVRRQEEAARAEALAARTAEIIRLGGLPEMYTLATMPQATYADLVQNLHDAAAERARIAAEAEARWIAQEAEERAERARILAEHRAKAEAAEAEAAKLRVAVRAEREQREAAERAERERLERESAARREQAESAARAARAPDKRKLEIYAGQLAGLPMPDVTSGEAKAILTAACQRLGEMVKQIKAQCAKL